MDPRPIHSDDSSRASWWSSLFVDMQGTLLPDRLDFRHLGAALAVVAVATGICFVMRLRLDLADLVMVYMLGITIVATRFGRWTALLASGLSVAALDFFFIPPHLTFAVQDVRHVGTFAVMLGVGWVVANLAERIRAQARQAQERERHTRALYRLGSVLAEEGSTEAIRDRVEAYLAQEWGLPVSIMFSDDHGHLRPRNPDGRSMGPEELAVAQWTLEHGLPSGSGTDTLPGSRGIYLPMPGTEHPLGVLALFPDPRSGSMEPDRQGLLPVFVSQISLALERAHVVEERTEARIRAEQEHLRNTLLSSVSHDLRTPLGTITGATSTLLSPGPAYEPEDQRMLLTTIHQESCRLQRLVNNLLDLTKLESGHVRVKKEWVPLDEVVGSALSHLEDQLADRSLSIHLPNVWVPLDPVLFEQVLLNLLDNAIKYSPAASPLEIHGFHSGQVLELMIADHGSGIPENETERVFEKLFRGHGAAGTSGAGLGLAICRAILQAHGGTICAENRPEGGALIRMTLPIEGDPPEFPGEDDPSLLPLP